MTGIRRTVVAVGALAAMLVVTAPARACTTLALGCAAGGTGSAVDGPLHDAGGASGGAVDDTVGDAGSAIDDTVGPVGGTVDDVTGAIGDTVDEVLGGGGTPPPPGVDPPEQPRPPDRDGRSEPGGRDAVAGLRPSQSSTASVAVSRLPPATTQVPAITQASSTSSGPAPDSPRKGFRDAIAAAAPSLVVVAALSALVMAFVFAQSWVDRRDPRLAAAPPADEMAWFR